jgi:hypothetical protein
MRAVYRFVLTAALILATSAVLLGCGGGNAQSGVDEPTTMQSDTTAVESGQDGAQAETELIGRPAGFPSDIPVHPGTVTAYSPMKVTESTTVHQLTVQTAASLADVVKWYKTKLPAGWSVGFSEVGDGEAKIALTGGSYTPASPDGMGGGVIIGLFQGDKTEITITVTVMGQ